MVGGFLDVLASRTSVPGGGAAAALTVALGAAMVEMACSFALGKKKFAGAASDLQHTSSRCREIRLRASILADCDGLVYGKLVAAFGLPADSQIDREVRQRALSCAAEGAALVPLELVELCDELTGLGKLAASLGDANLIADAVGGVALARGAVRVCELNIKSNLAFVDNEEFVSSVRQKLVRVRGILELADALVEAYL